MPQHRTTLSTLAVAVLAPLALAGCGSSSAPSTRDGTASRLTVDAVAARADATRHTAADADFAAMMIPHHRQAVEMAKLAAARAGSPEVKALAGRIEAAQGPEIATMSGWLRDWGRSGRSGHAMGGMMSRDEMSTLASSSGTAFDRQFLTMMIAHHEGAIAMADSEMTHGRNGDALALAASIAVSQQGQVREMKALLG